MPPAEPRRRKPRDSIRSAARTAAGSARTAASDAPGPAVPRTAPPRASPAHEVPKSASRQTAPPRPAPPAQPPPAPPQPSLPPFPTAPAQRTLGDWLEAVIPPEAQLHFYNAGREFAAGVQSTIEHHAGAHPQAESRGPVRIEIE